ncbi:MAG: hypothetical protein LBN21_08475 [Treponema sp.]|jgi:hypothetical protein|nr:hypothetical protein [Treponema sp.]
MKIKNCRRFLTVFLAGAFTLSLSGCTTIAEGAGRVVDGSAFAEKKLARYRVGGKQKAAKGTAKTAAGVPIAEALEVRNRAGDESIVITLEEFPAIKIRGSAPKADGSFYLTALEFLSGSYSGWNEFTLDLSGNGTFSKTENGASLSIPPPLEPVQISAGKIRRGDSRITGGESLTLLRNRRERILALTEWMQSSGFPQAEDSAAQEGAPPDMDRKAFENYWKPILLPELVSKKKRPASYQNKDTADPKVSRVRAESINWNVDYTKNLFPENLWPLRDSGALLRDWEESFEWIYFEYNWNKIAGELSDNIIMEQIK